MRPLSPLLSLLTLAALFLTGCGNDCGRRVRGNGPVETETRTVAEFTRLDVSVPAEVYLTQGPTAGLRLEAQRNVLAALRTDVRSGELRLDANGADLRVDHPIRVYVTVPTLTYLSGSGTAHYYTQGPWTTPDLTVVLSGASGGDLTLAGTGALRTDLSGASELTLAGSFGSHECRLSGASQLWAFDLPHSTADVDASGASTAHLTVSHSLTVHASGASSVYYKGSPSVSVDASGGSRVIKQD